MEFRKVIDYLGSDWEKVRVEMSSALATDVDLLEKVNSEILENGGKMLRPALTLLMARAIGNSTDDTLRVAAASQMIHNSTLLHDDVVDDSPMRRGKPTAKSILGNTASVLIGDFWLVKAVDLIMATSHEPNLLLRIYAKTLSDLAEGEMLQLEKSNSCNTTMEEYLRIIYCKTASLFEVSTLSAAVSVGASQEVRKAAAEYGRLLGIAFQIRDDIMDYDSGSEIGKPVGIDLKERKITLPLLGAMGNAGKSEEKRIRTLVSGISDHEENCGIVRDFVIHNGGVEYARRVLEEYAAKAGALLKDFTSGKAGEILEKLTRYIAERKV